MNDTPRASRHHPLRRCAQVVGRTAANAWDDSIFGKSATAAFWQTLSLAPLLLGLLGSLGYVGGWFGPNTVEIIQSKIISFSRSVFSENVVDQIIGPTVSDVLGRGRPEIVSAGFLLSLWAGSSAISTFVDSIVEAHGQQDARHPVWQRVFALLLYVGFLALSVFTLPLVALGPTMAGRALPAAWHEVGTRLIDAFYYPAVGLLLIAGLTTLYKVALPKSLPWHRLLGGALLAGAFFLGASTILRWYLSWIAGTGYTYGALATPIAFLLFTFFLGFAIVLGAEFNATIQEFWPARATRMEQVRDWIAAQAAIDASEESGPVTSLTRRLATRPIRFASDSPSESSSESSQPPDEDASPSERDSEHDETASAPDSGAPTGRAEESSESRPAPGSDESGSGEPGRASTQSPLRRPS